MKIKIFDTNKIRQMKLSNKIQMQQSFTVTLHIFTVQARHQQVSFGDVPHPVGLFTRR